MPRLIYTLLICLLGLSLCRAEALPINLSRDAQISILVASPSDREVYTYYGHAGLRVWDSTQGLDVTFNYGIFSFTDDFLYRFVKGQTDYMVMPQYTSDYMSEYLGRGSSVEELILSLDSVEKSRIWTYLLDNIHPEKRAYRYQFFTDNCATRPLYIIELATGGLSYARTSTQELTWRDEINMLEASSPWLVLGTDLALGSPTDEVMKERDKAFSPRYLKELLHGASNSKGQQVLLRVEQYPAQHSASTNDTRSWLLNPMVVCSTLFVIISLLYIYGVLIRRAKLSLLIDAILFTLAGLGGLVLFYISVLSEHQFVSPNYNLWILQPLHLLVLVSLLPNKNLRNWVICYHFANFVEICVFLLVASFLPQHFNLAIYPIALSLAVVSLARLIENKRREPNPKHGA